MPGGRTLVRVLLGDCGLLIASSHGRPQGGSQFARDSYQGTNRTHEGSTLMTSFNPSQSFTSNTLGGRVSTYTFEGWEHKLCKHFFLKERKEEIFCYKNRDSACCLGAQSSKGMVFLFIKGAVFISLRTHSSAHVFLTVKAWQGGLLIFFLIEKPQTFAFNFLATPAAFDF